MTSSQPTSDPLVRRLIFGCTVGFLLLALVAPIAAIDDPTVAPADPDPSPTPEALMPIVSAEITAELEAFEAVLQRAKTMLLTNPEIEDIEDGLPEFRLQIDERQRQEARSLETAPPRMLRDVRGSWAQTAEQLLNWDRTLSRRINDLEETRQDLETRAKIWELTLQTATDKGLPEPIQAKAQGALTEAHVNSDALNAKTDKLLTLQVEIGELRHVVLDELTAIQAQLSQLKVNLFRPDCVPIWRVVRDPLTDLDIAGQLIIAAEKTRDRLALYLESAAIKILIQGVGVALIVAFLLYTRRNGLTDASGQRKSRVLDRPLSAALLVALVVGTPLHRGAPAVYEDLRVLLGLAALMRLLPVLLPVAMRPVLYGLGFVALIHWAAYLIPVGLLANRVLWLLTTASGLAMVRPLGTRVLHALGDRSTAWRRFVPLTVGAGAALLIASLLINLSGNLGLSILLTTGTLMAIYMAAALWTVAVVVDDLTVMLLRSDFARRFRAVSHHPQSIREAVTRLTTLAAVVMWSFGVLNQFALLEPTLGLIKRTLVASTALGSVELSLGDVLLAAAAIWLSFKLSALIRFLLDDEVFSRVSLPAGVPESMSRLTHYVVLVIGFFIALGLIGFNFDRLTLVAGAFGVGIGFGLQTIVNNFVSGLILLFERPIRIGDRISLGELSGVVTSIGIRASTVRTFEGAEVVVPNGTLIASELINWTLSDPSRRVEIVVGVAYGTDPAVVIDLLVATASAHPEVMREPEPLVLFTGFGDSSLDFSLRLWCPFETHLRVGSEVRVAITRAFDEAGVKIPFPQRDLHLRTVADPVDTSAAVTAPADG